MPATVDPLTEERWAPLVESLRAASPQPPEELLERVRSSAARPAPARHTPSARALARLLVPVGAVVLVAMGGVIASGSLGSASHEGVGPAQALQDTRGVPGAVAPVPGPEVADSESEAAASPSGGEPTGAPFAPAPSGRLQEQRIALGVRVPDVEALSDATARAMQTARDLGGFVVAAHYDVPSTEDGDSTLLVRVPVSRVQEAIARFTALGTIVSQDVRLQDLQPAYDRRERELQSLRERIARLERQLAAEDLTQVERARLRSQLVAARRAVDARVAQQRAAEQQGRLARVELVLTTRTPEALPVPEDGATATLRAAAEILARILVFLAAGLIVTGPFALLAVLAVLAARGRRRVLQARLLERS